MKFAAKMICNTPPQQTTTVKFGDTGFTFVATERTCQVEGLAINGIRVIDAVQAGAGLLNGRDGTGAAEGYEWGRLDNGDYYLARWKEQIVVRGDGQWATGGSWEILLGTGKIQGIKGVGSITCPSRQSPDETGGHVCDLIGEYVLGGQ